MELEIARGEEWLAVGGSGLLKAEMLADAGYDPQAVSGYALGMGLERLAMIKYGIASIRQLWSAPYIPV